MANNLNIQHVIANGICIEFKSLFFLGPNYDSCNYHKLFQLSSSLSASEVTNVKDDKISVYYPLKFLSNFEVSWCSTTQ